MKWLTKAYKYKSALVGELHSKRSDWLKSDPNVLSISVDTKPDIPEK